MAMIPLVPKTKKNISNIYQSAGGYILEWLWYHLFPKQRWRTSVNLAVSRTYWSGKSRDLCSQLYPRLWFCPAHLEPTTWQGLPIYTLIFQELILSISSHRDSIHSLSPILTSRDSTLSHSLTFWLTETALSLSLHFRLPETAWPCCLVIQFNTHNMVVYTFCNLFLTCSAFLVRLVPALNTASEISSNPKRDNQPTWEKTHSS